MNKSVTVWKRTALAAICLLLAVCVLFSLIYWLRPGSGNAGSSESGQKTPVSGNEALSLWTDSSETKKQLVSYMETVTNESSADFIPVDQRIAVFDFDGTLFCETDPDYFDYCLLVHRVTQDPDYKASEFERATVDKILRAEQNGESFPELPVEHGQAIASAFAGMTMDEFFSYIAVFKKTEMNHYNGMTRGGGFYLPMLEIVDYLQANDFTVYIISGTDRFIVRGLLKDSPLSDIPPAKIIGSDERLAASNQGDKDGLDYTFTKDDKVVLGGDFIIKNLKMNKVQVIMQEIGQQPVLAFGNSTGDSSMLEHTIVNNPYKSLSFMLCCDDLEREDGNLEKAEKVRKLSEENGWIPVSMKDDWKTIYGDSVTRKIVMTENSESEAVQNAA